MRLLIAILCTLLFACEPEAPTLEMQCAEQGGTLTIGAFGNPVCIIPTSDGGKACTGNADCEDTCLFTGSTTVACEERTSGTCSGTFGHFGCQCAGSESGTPAIFCAE
jgi:hypothetical protein